MFYQPIAFAGQTMKRSLILLIIPISILISCSEKDKNTDNVHNPLELFNEVKKLESNEIEVEGSILRAFSLTVFDSLLIVNDPNELYHYKLYNLNTGKLLTSFAKLGEGPCEFAFPTSIQIVPGKPRHVGLFNRRTFKYSSFSIDSLLKNNTINCESTSGVFKIDFQKVIQVSDTLFAGTGLFKRMYATANVKGDTLGTYEKYPFEEKLKTSHTVLAMAYQGNILPHPAGNAFVSATLHAGCFDIMNVNNGNLVTQKSYRFWGPVFEGTDGSMISARIKKANVEGYSDIYVNDKYIYLLFSGKNFSDENSQSGSIVLVFDWAGEPVIEYDLQKDVEQICIDAKGENLYAYNDDGKAHILKFKL